MPFASRGVLRDAQRRDGGEVCDPGAPRLGAGISPRTAKLV
jgi:hypothetical protein